MIEIIIVALIWFSSLLITNILIAKYIKKYNDTNLIIGVYVIYLALTQIMAVKMVDINGFTFDAANIIFPFIFQLTDAMNEYFGKDETKKMIKIALFSQILMVLFIMMSNLLPASNEWWLTQDIWLQVFGQNWAIVIGSWVTLYISNNLDAFVFDKIKQKTGSKHIWIRNIFSDIPSLFIDTIIFVTLTWVILTNSITSFSAFVIIVIGQLLSKWLFGVIDTPFIYLQRYIIEK